MDYTPRGVCAKNIHLEVEDGIIKQVSFSGGCSGNAQGVSALVEGRKAQEVIPLLENIKCGIRSTSCPAQLAKALKEEINKRDRQ